VVVSSWGVGLWRGIGDFDRFGALGSFQALCSWCLWSLRRLWVVARSRHSDLTADLPRRENVRAPRLCLIWPKTGSTSLGV